MQNNVSTLQNYEFFSDFSCEHDDMDKKLKIKLAKLQNKVFKI